MKKENPIVWRNWFPIVIHRSCASKYPKMTKDEAWGWEQMLKGSEEDRRKTRIK